MDHAWTDLSLIYDLGQEITLEKDDVLFHHHAKANYLFLLLEGEIQLFGNSVGQSALIGRCYTPGTPVGLGFFGDPRRYESEARIASETIKLLRWKYEDLQPYLDENPAFAIEFLRFVNSNARNLIEESSELFLSISGEPKVTRPRKYLNEAQETSFEFDLDEAVLFLLQSPFFEVFPENYLTILAQSLKRYQFSAGTIIHAQGSPVEGIYILEHGEVQFSRLNTQRGDDQTVWFRSISTPGYLLGASGVLNGVSDMTMAVSKDAVIYHLPLEAINVLESQDLYFGILLQKRVTWLLSNQFRMVQARLLSAEFGEEIQVVSNLIENNQAKLHIDSPLHLVPHLLSDKLTIKQGLDILHHMEKTGNAIERNLSSLSLDNLKETEKEANFFDGLKNIYKSVVDAHRETSPADLRELCNNASRKVFSIPQIQLKGYTNFPEKPGNIFIYNHLLNDPFYTLPNQFQITLDAHYLSMLISEKYGDSALRIVRIGRESEYAHEDYYGPQGFINVYTAESRKTDHSRETKEVRRQKLNAQVEGLLKSGKNLIVSPEGTSFPTDQSPGGFKSAIFRVAMQMNPEPLIVPIVVANFDQRIPNNVFKCEIKEPFKISEKLRNSKFSELKEFLKDYQMRYKQFVTNLAQSRD